MGHLLARVQQKTAFHDFEKPAAWLTARSSVVPELGGFRGEGNRPLSYISVINRFFIASLLNIGGLMAKAGLIRVLLVEDNAIVIQTVRSVLHNYPNIEVVGEAGDGEEGVLKAGQLQPTVVLMDINIPKMDGIAATRLIKTNYPHIAVVGLTLNTHGYNLDAMQKAGAFEVLSKEKAFDDLYGTIQRAVASIQPILVLEDITASAISHTELKESASSNPKDVAPAKDSKKVTERQSGPEN
jgi:DNA-binding NarL/FixJ family response regulator